MKNLERARLFKTAKKFLHEKVRICKQCSMSVQECYTDSTHYSPEGGQQVLHGHVKYCTYIISQLDIIFIITQESETESESDNEATYGHSQPLFHVSISIHYTCYIMITNKF